MTIKKPELYSSVYPWRLAVDYADDTPSMTRQEFSAECDINNIMRNYEATGIMPSIDGREPMYFDATSVPDNLQEAMNGMIMAETAFSQLPASIRKEFDNDAVKFVEYALQKDNLPKLREWGLAPPEPVPEAPMRVEVVNPAPPSEKPAGEAPKAS